MERDQLVEAGVIGIPEGSRATLHEASDQAWVDGVQRVAMRGRHISPHLDEMRRQPALRMTDAEMADDRGHDAALRAGLAAEGLRRTAESLDGLVDHPIETEEVRARRMVVDIRAAMLGDTAEGVGHRGDGGGTCANISPTISMSSRAAAAPVSASATRAGPAAASISTWTRWNQDSSGRSTIFWRPARFSAFHLASGSICR